MILWTPSTSIAQPQVALTPDAARGHRNVAPEILRDRPFELRRALHLVETVEVEQHDFAPVVGDHLQIWVTVKHTCENILKICSPVS